MLGRVKWFAGVVGFIVFVGALMAVAYFAARPTAGPHATTTAGATPKATTPSSTDTNPADDGQAAQNENKPVPLPALFVYRDDKDPKAIALAGARSKPILLHLWASWCGPCRAELPVLMQFAKTGPADLVAVSVDDHYEDVVKFFHGKVPAEVVWDKTISLERALGVENIPTTFLVDTNGNVIDRFDGAQPWDNAELAKAVADELK